jgi:DNA polymerase I-like protein with 3'-5' exonuclease and polymerase domains
MAHYALDIETSPVGESIPEKQAWALEPWSCGIRSKIDSLHIYDGENYQCITDSAEMRSAVERLRGHTVWGANTLFDVAYLIAQFDYDLVREIKWRDVQILGKIIENGDEHRFDSYSLASCAQKWAKDWPELEEFIEMKTKGKELEAGQDGDYWLQRGSWDVMVTLHIAKNQMKLLPKEQIRCSNIMQNCIAPLARGWVFGMTVDHSILAKAELELEQAMKGYLDDLSIAPTVISSSKQLGDLLFKQWGLKPHSHSAKTGAPSTAEGDLKHIHYRSKDERLTKIMKYKKLKTLSSKYFKGFKSAREYLGEDKIHGGPRIFAAATGRMSYSSKLQDKYGISIAMHQIPSRSKEGKIIKKALICPEGYGMIAFDFSSQEIRIAAQVSNDPTLIDVYHKGKDLHSVLASKIFGVDYDDIVQANKKGEPEQYCKYRQNAKLVNLSSLYRIGASSLANKFFEDYDVVISENDAKMYLASYKRSYSELPKFWMDSIIYAKKHGYATTMGGLRYYTKADDYGGEQSSINHRVQGSAAMQTYYVIGEIEKRFPEYILVNQVHDSLIYYVKDDGDLYEKAKALDDFLNNEVDYTQVWLEELKLRFTVDTNYGYSYGDLKPV